MNYPTKFARYYKIISEARSREGDNVPFLVMCVKIIYWIIIRKGNLFDFFVLRLYKKGRKIKDYISDSEFLAIHYKLNPRYYISILEDKYVFDRFLKSFGFPMAELIGLLENGIITWIPDRKTEPVENLLSLSLDCFCKFHTGWGGSQVMHLVINGGILWINNRISTCEELKSITKEGIYILQKTITQHPEMNRLNGSCVNTLRIITVHDGTSISKFGSFIRIGIGNSHVDNISAGNIACAIGNDGVLSDEASDAYLVNTGLTRHPDTKVVFGSFKIPFYPEAVDLTISMHKSFHCFFIIGWDVAITESGPVVIEGNPLSSIGLEQLFWGGERKRFLQLAKDYKKRKGLNF